MGKKAIGWGLIAAGAGYVLGQGVSLLVAGSTPSGLSYSPSTDIAIKLIFTGGLGWGVYKGLRESEEREKSKIEVDRALGVPRYTGQLKGDSREKTRYQDSYESRHKIQSAPEGHISSVTLEEAIDMFKNKYPAIRRKGKPEEKLKIWTGEEED